MKPIFTVLLSLAAMLLASDLRVNAAEKKLNVLFIAVDDMNNDVGYGSSRVVSRRAPAYR